MSITVRRQYQLSLNQDLALIINALQAILHDSKGTYQDRMKAFALMQARLPEMRRKAIFLENTNNENKQL